MDYSKKGARRARRATQEAKRDGQPKRRSAEAKALASPKFRQRVVPSKRRFQDKLRALSVMYGDEVAPERAHKIDDLVRKEFESGEWVTVEQETGYKVLAKGSRLT